MSNFQSRREVLAETAAQWRDPEYVPREHAVEATLDAPNRWTEEALEYALNRWMQRLTVEALDRWLGDPEESAPLTVGVLHGEAEPLDGLLEALAVWASGHSYLGHVPEASPALLPAFAEDVARRDPDLHSEFLGEDALFEQADAIMAQPDWEEKDAVRDRCAAHDIPQRRHLLRPSRLTIAVLDGHESDGERNRLAEDLLLYEGSGHRRLALLWGPPDLPPDPYLEAMAQFRGAFPAHPDTPGALQMQKAFLEARDAPRAYAKGLEFLVSRGDPAPQPPGHFRWVEYEAFDEIGAWIRENETRLYAVVARESLHDQLPEAWPLRTPGGLHVPPLDDAEGTTIANFVRTLG